MSPIIRRPKDQPYIKSHFTIAERISERLSALRTQKELTQQQIADAINLDSHFYEVYEMGADEPTLEVLIKLADYFQVSTDYLLGRSNDPMQH